MAIIKRISVFDRETSDAELLALVEQEYAKGNLDGFGKQYIHMYFRMQGSMISRYVHLRHIIY